MDFIHESSKKTPIKHHADVAILGGGPAGMSAAVSASKTGASVILIERYGFLGGQATGGLVIVLCGLNDRKERIIKGFCQDIIDYLEIHNMSKPWHNFIIFDPETLKRCLDEHIDCYGIKLLLHSIIADTIVEDDIIKAVIIESKSGRSAITARTFIDCTGDADTLKWCDEDFEQVNKNSLKHVTACFRVGNVNKEAFTDYINNNKTEFFELFKDFPPPVNPMHWAPTIVDDIIWFDMSHIKDIDITNVEDLTKAELITRKLSWEIFNVFKNKVPGVKNAYIIDIAPQLGIRDSRRLKGEYFITKEDYGKSFEDKVCYFPYYYDSEGIGRLEVPYRALVPKKIKNLLIAGRSASIEHSLIDCMREIPQCFATGQAAGVAASLAAKNNISVSSVNYDDLKGILLKQSVFL